jgi:hypothetical protein
VQPNTRPQSWGLVGMELGWRVIWHSTMRPLSLLCHENVPEPKCCELLKSIPDPKFTLQPGPNSKAHVLEARGFGQRHPRFLLGYIHQPQPEPIGPTSVIHNNHPEVWMPCEIQSPQPSPCCHVAPWPVGVHLRSMGN